MRERKAIVQKITPFLWFDGQAEEAATFYTSLFPGSEILDVRRSGAAGRAVSITFRLAGQDYIALNGGPQFTFSPAISLFISCDSQAEVDALWDKLSEGGTPRRCGWVDDRFGVTWQVVPRLLGVLMRGPEPARAKRVFDAMMTMTKFDIASLQRAYDAE